MAHASLANSNARPDEPTGAGATTAPRPYSEDALLYRQQFLIGPRFVDGLPSWQRLTVGDQFCITAHPDLSVCQVSEGAYSLTLLGYVLDPEHWQWDDKDILRALLQDLVVGDFTPALSWLGGRWVVVADTPRETLVVNDAFGMRQVHYTEGLAERWCAAQPGLLAATLGLAVDDRGFGALGKCANMEFWWPGPRTPYRHVARLSPNHSLDLRTGKVTRYWPDEPFRPRALAEAVDACCTVTQEMFHAAHRRFALAQTITAGWDSRLSLAASRAVSSDILYFSMRYWEMAEDHPDLAVPSYLLPKLGLEHQLIRCPDVMDPTFEGLYMRNAPPAHYAYGVIAQGMYNCGLGDRVCVKPCVANILRTHFILPPSISGPVRAQDLLRTTWLGSSQFILDSVDEWLAATSPHLKGWDLSEAFYWEHLLGGWQAASQHEWEIVTDCWDPMNSRGLMAILLSVPRELRSLPRNLIHRTAIEKMWPEALSAPVNPGRRTSRLSRLRRVVGRSWPWRVFR